MSWTCAANREQSSVARTAGEGPLVDLRRLGGKIWSWGSAGEPSSESSDEKMYREFLVRDEKFLAGVNGRFGAAYYDATTRQIFLCRDWVGEVPLHYYLTDECVVVANSIMDIREFVGPELFRYEFVRAVPHSHALLFESAESYMVGSSQRRSFRVQRKVLWCDFAAEIGAVNPSRTNEPIAARCAGLRMALEAAVRARLEAWPSHARVGVLLSGGIDSLCVAYLAKKIRPDVVAFTLEVGENGDDALRAREIAAAFGIRIVVVRVSPGELVADYPNAVAASEIYHLPNVYCAAGMRFLGRALEREGVHAAFCGEGANEALGDYHDWTIDDPRDGTRRVLQCVDDSVFAQITGRVRYVWGRSDTGSRYNFQLGSGLAKHGISRMVKPLLNYGVQLECPWLDHDLMVRLVSISGDEIERIGGKPGLMAEAFRREIESESIAAGFILNSRKIRLQDASEHGRGGLTGHLLAAGLDQAATLELFNRRFGAQLDAKLDAQRLGTCEI